MSNASVESPDDYIAVFAALGEPVRVRILHLIARQHGAELPCTLLDQSLPIGKSTISYHTAILRRAGLISVRKAGRNYYYQVREDTMAKFAPAFLQLLQDTEKLDFEAA
ncbi:hypothetical protein BH09ACT10_BH09ACT10_17260 [soil metagenome]